MRWVLGLFAAVSAGGCGGLPTTTVFQIEQADRAYREGRFVAAERLASQAISAHPIHPDIAEALYVRGLSRAASGDSDWRSKARADFGAALSISRRGVLSGLLQVQLGHFDYQDGRYELAARRYGLALGEIPPAMHSGAYWYMWGLSLQRAGRFDDSRAAFQHVIADTPSSEYAELARRKMGWPHPYFTIQCGAYSERPKAEAAAEALRLRGVAAISVRRSGPSVAPFVLYAGRYLEYASAVKSLSAIQAIQADAFVVP